MGHLDTSLALRIPSRMRGEYWVLRYHRAADELCLHEPGGQLVAGLTSAREHITRMSEAVQNQTGPIGVRIPCTEPSDSWALFVFPGANELSVRTPLGDTVGGMTDASFLIQHLMKAAEL